MIFFVFLTIFFLVPFISSKGSLYGDDLHFHLDRMIGLTEIWRSPVNFLSFYNSGQGINFFYPFVLYYPFNFLWSMTHSIWIAWYIYLFLITLFTLWIAFISARSISRSNNVAIIFAILYTFSAYRVCNILIRFAIGEVLAMTILPLVFAGAYHVFKGNSRKWYLLSIGMTLLCYSHLLSVFIVSTILAIVMTVFLFIGKQKKQRIISLFKATIFAILMSLFALVPMVEQFSFTKLASPLTAPLDNHLFSFQQLFSTDILTTLDKQLGVILLFSVPILLLNRKKLQKEWYWLALVSTVLVLLTTKLVTWEKLPLSLFKTIQFPWRLNAYITLFIAFLLSILLAKSHKYIARMIVILTIALNGFSVLRVVNEKAIHPVNEPFKELSIRNDYQKLTHAVFVPDYTNEIPTGTVTNITPDDPRWKVVQHEVYLNKEKLDDVSTTYSNTKAIFRIKNGSGRSQNLYLPVYFYKGQEVYIDGNRVESSLSEWSSTKVSVPAGDHEVKVTYSYTKLAKLSFISSLISLLVFLYVKFKDHVKLEEA